MPGVARCCLSDHFGRALRHNLSTTIATLRAHIDDPVGGFDDIEIVFNHHHRVACLDELIQHAQQECDVVKMQTRGGFVQNVEGLTCTAFGQLQG